MWRIWQFPFHTDRKSQGRNQGAGFEEKKFKTISDIVLKTTKDIVLKNYVKLSEIF